MDLAVPVPVTIRSDEIIIDHNADAGEALAMLLTGVGHEVKTGVDGASGIAMAASFVPEVILLDIGFPDMDGYEVAKQLHEAETGRRVTAIALTGYGLPAERRRTAEAGFDHHLTKPVDPDDVVRLLAART